MLRSATDLRHYKIHATDGELGRAHDLYFDDHEWTIRYLVVTTHHWLARHRVLVPGAFLRTVDHTRQEIHVALTKAQVADSPDVDTERPVSRQHVIDLIQYYGFPYVVHTPSAVLSPGAWHERGDTHLRSMREVAGYIVQEQDDQLGRVDDFLVDDASWIVRYLVLDTHTWWPGRKVLVSPGWVGIVRWEAAAVYVDLRRDTVKNAPTYDPGRPVDLEYERRLWGYYGRAPYWQGGPGVGTA